MLMSALAVGYVLGAKAGRERYDQIVGAAKQLGERPEVKRIVEQAPGAIEGKVGQVAHPPARCRAQRVQLHRPAPQKEDDPQYDGSYDQSHYIS